jgi:hypothetical protein
MRLGFNALFALLLGCAANPQASSERPLEAGFAGDWTGTASFATSSGRGAVDASVPVHVRVVGNTASVTGICPSSLRQGVASARAAEPFLDAAGAGAAAAWSGTLACPVVELFGCDAVRPTYRNATLTLGTTATLTAVAFGEADGCGTSARLLFTFVGSRL